MAMNRRVLASLVLGAGLLSCRAEADTAMLRGVNLAGAEFGFDRRGRGRFGIDYTYPSPPYAQGYHSPAYFVRKGMNVFRLPFRWERLQPVRNDRFDPDEWRRLRTTVDRLKGLGATVILDPHNFARYDDRVIGSEALPNADFADFWRRLAEYYGDDPQIIFGLMTEPYDMPTEQWVEAANEAIEAIREVGADNLILVPGNGWSGAFSWGSSRYGTPNAEAMLEIWDPADNIAFEAHQYLDHDSSGTYPNCVSVEEAVRRMEPFTAWLEAHGKRGFLGEFGTGASPTCLAGLEAMVDHVEANAEHYLGWTYWAAGPWWGDYFMSIEPGLWSDPPQLDVLVRYLEPD